MRSSSHAHRTRALSAPPLPLRLPLRLTLSLTLPLSLALSACDAPPPIDELVTPTLDECVAPLNLNTPSLSCARDLLSEPHACLSIELEGGRKGISLAWREGALTLIDGGPLTLPRDHIGDEAAPTPASLTLWRRGAEGDCAAVEPSAPCDPEGGCALRVRFSLAAVSDGRITPISEDFAPLCEWSHPAGDEGVERCDGVDNDCDALVDEGFEVGAPCGGGGEGVCATEGVWVCTGDGAARCALPDSVTAPQERCDGIDNDCDTLVDEGLTPDGVDLGAPCEFGLGACAVSANYRCVTATDERELDERALSAPSQLTPPREGEVACLPPRLSDAPAPPPEALDDECDGIDEDCDGFMDEGFVRELTTCGEAACASSGQLVCVEGALSSTCQPGAPAEADTACDGVDEDCDGRADEEALPSRIVCGLGECARFGDRLCFNNAPREVCTPGVPDAAEGDVSCNQRDEDCDGLTDEGFTPSRTTCGVGACAAEGERVCVNGSIQNTCAPSAPLGDDRTCDGVDDDCDGRMDEATPTQELTCGVGACLAAGLATCDPQGTPPGLVDRCVPLTPLSSDDRCDGIDLDCDGEMDEDHTPTPTRCGVGACARSGLLECVNGVLQDTCAPLTPTAGERDAGCDGVDADCDGRMDEGYTPTATTCGASACASEGQLLCVSGAQLNTCVEGEPASRDSTCDGRDDDCDGRADEDTPSEVISCGFGVCATTGARQCVRGQIVSACTPLQPSINERDTSCDRRDQDCDGRYDEGYPTQPITCGIGACARQGLRVCSGSAVQDQCTPGAPTPDTSCDLIDQDCDGRVDEGFAPTATSCGQGACARSGQLRCLGGETVNTCTPGSPATADPVCDAQDSDCDGRTDEDFLGALIICGSGPCQTARRATCDNGQINESCTPNTAASAPDIDCDRFDDDCDGRLDEAYTPQVVTCPPGSCGATAQQICTNAGLTNTCVTPTTTLDATCDGVDDDCDGLADEDYLAPPTQLSCGVGACRVSNGYYGCVSGDVSPICTPNAGAARPDTDCDRVDDDCDGRSDEAFPALATSCGVGVCARSGLLTCSGGQVTSDCVPGLPGQELCGDALDNDCDRQTDEGFESIGETCERSSGLCYATGSLICSGDRLSLTCSAQITPRSERCDGLDNDCDGRVDEGFSPCPVILE